MAYVEDLGTRSRGSASDSEEVLLQEIRNRFTYANGEWKEIRDEGAKDMRYVAGDPWEPSDRAKRVEAGRPVLAFDEIGQYLNQGINELRVNKRAVKFTPTGNGADDDTAEFYGNKMREIEYRSKAASIHYITAAENMYQRSYGFIRVKAKHEHPRSVNQDLWIEAFPNPDLVTPDPDALMPTCSDMKYCFVREPYEHEEFRDRWKDAKIRDFGSDLIRQAPDWVREDRVYVGEYWKVKTRKRKLLIFAPAGAPEPVGYFEDEVTPEMLQQLGSPAREEQRDDAQVCQYLTNGLEILETKEWPGKYIPIIACLGKVLYLNEGGKTKRKLMSLVRLARDPQMMYCYLWSGEAEIVGATPRIPHFAYEGQISPREMTLLEKSMHEPVACIQVKPIIDGAAGHLLPFPQRAIYEPPLQAFEISKESARRAIQAAMGQTPLPTAAQRRNEKSGKALDKMDEMTQRGNFHFGDHFTDMIEHCGVVCEDLLDKILDTKRKTGIRKPNETAEIVTINDPDDEESVSTKGDHLVTVSTGPNNDSERETAKEFAGSLLDAKLDPRHAAALLPLIVKLANLGPIGDEIIEIAKALQPPEIQALEARKGDQADPAAQLQAALQQKQQLEQMAQILTKQVEGLTQTIETDEVKAEAQKELKGLELQAQHRLQVELQEMKNAAAIRIAEINAAIKGYQTEAQHAAQHEEQALNIAASSVEGDLEREQASAEAERQREHETRRQEVDLTTKAAESEASRAHEASMQQSDGQA